MSNAPTALFDPSVLPAALETSDADTLVSFYEMFILVTRDSWLQLGQSTLGPDMADVRSVAHKLKSSSASIGAMRLRDALLTLEQLAAKHIDSAPPVPEVSEQIDRTSLLINASVNIVQAHIDSLKPR